MLSQLRNFRTLWVTTIVLACFSDAFAQTSYKIIDLGVLNDKDNLSCAMDLNNNGWTMTMNAVFDPGDQDSLLSYPVTAHDAINNGEFKIALGSLGGPNQNSWMMWGGINDLEQAVGFSETAVPDPGGEDICGFGTHLTCRPFLWQFGHMSALPTLGGNNGQASDINNRGEIVGKAQTTVSDTTCSPSAPLQTMLPVLWENGRVRALPTVDRDPDGVAYAINDLGQAVGDTGNCAGGIHAVSWENDTAVKLQDFKNGATAYGINHQGQIVGSVGNAEGTTMDAALWQNGVLTTITTLPEDSGAIATGINDRGQVVGSTWDSQYNWSHAFIVQDGVMINLNTLIPESSNLYATMANKINERGQISGMATVLSGPHKNDIHAFLATPVNESVGTSVADVSPTHPKSNLPANLNKQLFQRFGLGRLAQ